MENQEFEKMLEKYADVVVKVGLNLKKKGRSYQFARSLRMHLLLEK